MFAWNYSAYMLPFLLSVMITLSLIFIGWQRHTVKGGWPFLFLLTTIAIYSLGYTLELGSQNVPTLLFFAKFEIPGIALMPVAWLLLVLVLTNHREWFTLPRTCLLCLIPVITILLAWTNEYHHLIWQDIRIHEVNGLAGWESDYGLWYVIHIVYFQTLTLIGVLLLLQAIKQSSDFYKRQVTAVLLALLIPWLTNIVYFLEIVPLPLNPTTFAFAVTGMIVAWAIWRFHFLNLVPVARDTIIEMMPDGIIVIDAHGRIIDMNPAAHHITRTPAKTGEGQVITAVLPALAPHVSSQTAMAEKTLELTINLNHHQSNARIYECQLTALPNQDHQSTGSIIILKDITSRKETETVLKTAKVAAENARQEAEAASLAKSTFLSNMSHELRTPLTIISLYTDILKKLAHTRQQEDFLPRLNQIHFSAKHLSTIVDDILNYSKIEAGMIEIHEEFVDVHQLLEEIEMMAQPLMLKNTNDFRIQCDPDVTYLMADQTKLRQILLNLVSNAAKFTEAGEILLSVSRSTPKNQEFPHLRFELSDTGIGMSPEETVDIFEPFTQVDSSNSRQHGGTGLGLAISHRFCQMMDGDIIVRSEPNHGSTFIVNIPLKLPETSGVRAMPN